MSFKRGTRLLLLVLPLLFLQRPDQAEAAIGQDFNERSTCVIVHLKRDPTPYHLTVACDGERVSNQALQVSDELIDIDQFHRSLYSQFIALVDGSGSKRCRQYEVDSVWWASCSR